MTIQQIKDKIENLEYWLTENPNDPYHVEVQKDKRAYEHKLLLIEGPIDKALTP